MSTPHLPPPDDATLVAWLDGELPADEAARLTTLVHRDERLHARVRLLRAARAEFAWAFAADDTAPAPRPSPRRGTQRWPALGALLVAAAAALLVVWFATRARTPRDDAAANAWLELRLAPTQPAWDLFAPIRFRLSGSARTTTPVRIVARNPGETDAQLADRIAADTTHANALPVVLEAEFVSPDGSRRLGTVPRLQPTFTTTAGEHEFDLVHVQCTRPGISPYVAVRFTPDGPVEDFLWAFQTIGSVQRDGVTGCVPEDVGTYRLTLTLRSFTAPGDARFARFAEPLTVATGFAVRGLVGAWSEPVDGLRARLVAATARPPAGRPVALALQLRNDSDRARAFNVVGVTLAPIPQPFHFELVADGTELKQRTDLGVTISWSDSFLEQAEGSVRTVVFSSDYWRGADGAPLHGAVELGVRFRFTPTAWTGGDSLWQGVVAAPPIALDFGRR